MLAQARRADVPLLERLRYLTIVSSNLDEFFEVRFPDSLDAVRAGGSAQATARHYAEVSADAHALIDEQYRVLNEELMPAPAAHGIHLINHAQRDAGQRRCVQLLRAPGASAAGAQGARPLAPVSDGGQQEPELHRAAGGRCDAGLRCRDHEGGCARCRA